MGQHIAALDYLLPREYVQTMRILHSQAPSTDVKDIYRVIREDLKQDVSKLRKRERLLKLRSFQPFDIFESIDPEPLGTASLAQVHKATLKDGTVLAVKVQHPYVQGILALILIRFSETLMCALCGNNGLSRIKKLLCMQAIHAST